MARKSTSRRTARPRRVKDRTRERKPPPGGPETDAFSMSDEALEEALRSGQQAGLLEDYFGPARYAELSRLARDAAAGSLRGADRVLILPGIMGSKLGFDNFGPFDDVIWLDPIDIGLGRLTELSLEDGRPEIAPLGVLLLTYLELKLRLRLAGHAAEFHPYDWRKSLADLGRDLAARVDALGGTVHLVGHSMGGLVARACLAHRPERLGRIVMLGTPNHGSFSPVQAFRGTNPVVRRIDFIDPFHSGDELAGIFATFPGLYQMMPSPNLFAPDLFSLSSWPSEGVLPRAELLESAREVQAGLPGEYDDLVMIAGVDRETIVAASVRDGEFVYTTSREGDGTVPLKAALIAGARRTYFVAGEHGSLPGINIVARAVDSILATGETSLLPDRWEPVREGPVRTLRESELVTPPYDGQPGRPLGVREKRHLLDGFASAPEVPAFAEPVRPVSASPGAPRTLAHPASSEAVVVGRRRQHRLDVTLARGSITEADASAYVVGMFRHVAPGGAALALDRELGGAIAQAVGRRMFGANVGEIFMLPTGRHPLRADVVALAGLGAFDGFEQQTTTGESLAVLEAVGENLVRTFVSTRVDEFATVLFGGASSVDISAVLQRLFTGFLRGLCDADTDHHFRGVTLCETDPGRFAQMRQSLYDLAQTDLFADVEVTLRDVELPEARRVQRDLVPRPPQSVYLIVRQEPADGEEAVEYVASVLTAGERAAVFRGRQPVDLRQLDRHLKPLGEGVSFDALPGFGRELAELVLPEGVRTILDAYPEHPLVVVHDAPTSRVPWEVLHLGQGSSSPTMGAGLSHRYEAEGLSVAKWLEERQRDPILDVLLVINPTNDLDGAAREGDRVRELFAALGPAARIRELRGNEARRHEVLNCLASGSFDVVHYAGHAFFDRLQPERSGIVCAGQEVLAGADLVNLGALPSLVFFNACESGKVRRGSTHTQMNAKVSTRERVQRGVSFAEAFLRGGIANYLGTYWPVGDAPADAFARIFYEHLLEGRSLGASVMAGRQAVFRLNSVDWADYILYGDPDFVLKNRAPNA